MVTFKWIKGEVPNELLIKQVYGIVFDDYGRVLLRIEDNKYLLTGGTPEDYDKTIEDTLKREFIEEVNITLKDIKMLGYQLVDEQNGTEPFAQIRMIAKIDKVGELRPDPDNGKTYERFLTTPDKAINYLNWGKVGEEQIKDAVKLFEENYTLKTKKETEEYI